MSETPTMNAAQTLAYKAQKTKDGIVDEHEVIRQCYLYHITTAQLMKQMDDCTDYRFYKYADGSFKIEKVNPL